MIDLAVTIFYFSGSNISEDNYISSPPGQDRTGQEVSQIFLLLSIEPQFFLPLLFSIVFSKPLTFLFFFFVFTLLCEHTHLHTHKVGVGFNFSIDS